MELAPGMQRCIARYTEPGKGTKRIEIAIGENGLVFMRRRQINDKGRIGWGTWNHDTELGTMEDIDNLPASIVKNTWVGHHLNAKVDIHLGKNSIIDSTVHKYQLPTSRGSATRGRPRKRDEAQVEQAEEFAFEQVAQMSQPDEAASTAAAA